MKKVLLSKDLHGLFSERDSFLDRSDIIVELVTSNDEVLRICSEEDVDLIVTRLDMPGMRSEELFDLIRKDPTGRKASIIMVCNDTLALRERCKNCKANAVITLPVDPVVLEMKMQQLLNVAQRMQYRAMMAVAIEGRFRDRPVPFHTVNISTSGTLIRTTEPLVKGAGVFLSFFLPDGTHVSGYGEIVRVEMSPGDEELSQYGIRFTNVEEETKTAIEKAIRSEAERTEQQEGS
jgi:CheY-like chemotaxis protein